MNRNLNYLVLRELRTRLSYSQEKMAGFFGVSIRTYSNYENNGTKIPYSVIFLSEVVLSIIDGEIHSKVQEIIKN